ncbi:NAD(+) diphosphatase [Ningiella sp. W23]|uniref:NAD(+) diphosphatase n=1 Tax=Ningiella sp. W23 TaxID=3023715 RepID=UPI0037570F89
MSPLKKIPFIFSDNRWVVPNRELEGIRLTSLFDISLDDFSSYEHDQVIDQSAYGAHILLDMQKEVLEQEDYQLLSMREALAVLSFEEFQHLAKAWQYAIFLRTHRYCGQCGDAMQKVQWEMAMHCYTCGHRSYPRVSPCIIVSIRKDDKILLAQGVRHQRAGFFSTLAGFVESGESLEQAVHREVKEEVGIEVKNIEYFGSQAWPFPHSIMVGYLADYAGGDLVLDKKEILSADWFDIDALPKIPPKLSIAGLLIEETLKRIQQLE